jgi:hypothetical protein
MDYFTRFSLSISLKLIKIDMPCFLVNYDLIFAAKVTNVDGAPVSVQAPQQTRSVSQYLFHGVSTP